MVAGTNSLSKNNNWTQTFKVKDYIYHEAYKVGVRSHDIGLIKVDKSIQFNEKVGPINLMNSDFDKINYSVILTGWGYLSMVK